MQKNKISKKILRSNKTNLAKQLVEWTYIKQLFIETLVDWYSINVPELKDLPSLKLIIQEKMDLYIWLK